MLKAAALGIAVVLEEGAAMETVMDADVVFTSINSALDLLTNPLRLIATLRS
jgi:soluble P-type ATPase